MAHVLLAYHCLEKILTQRVHQLEHVPSCLTKSSDILVLGSWAMQYLHPRLGLRLDFRRYEEVYCILETPYGMSLMNLLI